MAAADKLIEVPENVRMLQRIIVQMNEDMNAPLATYDSYLDKAAKYTGLQKKVLENLKNNDVCNIEFKEIDRSGIYRALATFYLEQNIIPSTKQLFEALYGVIPPYTDIKSFRKVLVKLGFIWKRKKLSDFECVVIERPEIIFERYEYLKNIINYRKEGKNIYFIDENALKANGECLTQKESKLFSKHYQQISQQRIIYAVSKTGVNAVKFVDNFDEDAFTEWLDFDLLPNVKNDSVIVLDKSTHHCEQVIQPPNKDSLKMEMHKWLEYHKVPFNEEMSKYELVSLIENFTDVNENMYKIDRMIKQRGHSVLRVPDCINKLTPASLVFRLINENKELLCTAPDISETAFVEALESIPPEYFKEFDEYIAGKEKDIFDTDMKIDSVIDGLLEKLEDQPSTGDYDSNIPSCSDSE